MKNLNEIGLVVGAIILFIGIIAILLKKIKRKKEILFHDLKKKNLVSDFSKIRVKRRKVEIINPPTSSFDFEQNLNYVSQKFGRSFYGADYFDPKGILRLFKDPKVILLESNFPKKPFIYPVNLKLKPSELYFGIFQDQTNLILEQDITSSVIIEGQTRAGKTSLINTIILSFIQKNDHYQIIIADTKNSFSKLKEKENFKIYDPRNQEELKSLAEEVKRIDEQIESNKFLLENVDNNLEELRVKEKLELPRTLIVAEEVYEWLYADKKEKEEYSLKLEIIKNFKTIITKGRAFGCSIVFASQAQHSNDLPFKENLIQTKIYSQTTDSLSQEKVGSDILVSDSLKNGRFYITNPFKKGFFQAPLVSKNDLSERLK